MSERRTWTLALSWGPTGGRYVHNGFAKRACLGRLAMTFVPIEIDDLMEAYAYEAEALAARATVAGDAR